MFDGRVGCGELDQGLGVFGRILGRRDAGLGQPAQLAEVGAELRGAGLHDAAGELEGVVLEGGAQTSRPMRPAAPTTATRVGATAHTSSGVGRRWAERSRVSCR